MRVRKARAPHIEPEAVVKAALEILDIGGLEHVTLRLISSKVGFQSPALDWHFKDKQDIIDDMAQAILVEGGLEDIKRPKNSAAWAEWLIETGHAVRRAMISHRDGGRVVAGASFRARTLARLSILTTRVLKEAGFDLLHASMATWTTYRLYLGVCNRRTSRRRSRTYSRLHKGMSSLSPTVWICWTPIYWMLS